MTARWVVDEVQPHRDLNVTWQPISLLFKNEPEEGSDYYAASKFTHDMLRVMESVRTTNGNDGVFRLYWELGSRIHHDKNREFTAAEALAAVGLDVAHAVAFDDESWDSEIRRRMDVGLELVGDDGDTPIIAVYQVKDEPDGYFGPVINKVPDTKAGLAMWDALVAMMDVDSFFELKRTRSGGIDFGERPHSADVHEHV